MTISSLPLPLSTKKIVKRVTGLRVNGWTKLLSLPVLNGLGLIGLVGLPLSTYNPSIKDIHDTDKAFILKLG